MKAYLALKNGTVFEGEYFGAELEVTGEIVFATGMTGYLETLTDQSYYGQIVLQTFPLIGNYGIIPSDFESNQCGLSGYIVKYYCEEPSNFRSEGNLDEFLKRNNIVGLHGIDTRALTKIIRKNGAMNGRIMKDPPTEQDFESISEYKITNPVENVTAKKQKHYKVASSKYNIALYDFGSKKNIHRMLNNRGCDVVVFPAHSTAEEIMSINPDGIMLSNGPGDPADNEALIKNIKKLMKQDVPMFGICLGHQLMALASGFKTRKLKYGHRGANQSVKDVLSGKLFITSQNHGYEVLAESIDENIATEWFVNVNDQSNEGIIYKNKHALSVQFHPEACGGPMDTMFLFDKFIDMLDENV